MALISMKNPGLLFINRILDVSEKKRSQERGILRFQTPLYA